MFVVARDFGFAPNPFHGVCTLATCKPVIRRVAATGDWVLGVGGSRLRAEGRLVFGMQVSSALTYDEYWHDPRYRDKRPVRNGSRKMVVGDNITIVTRLPAGGYRRTPTTANPMGRPTSTTHDTTPRPTGFLCQSAFTTSGRPHPQFPRTFLPLLITGTGEAIEGIRTKRLARFSHGFTARGRMTSTW